MVGAGPVESRVIGPGVATDCQKSKSMKTCLKSLILGSTVVMLSAGVIGEVANLATSVIVAGNCLCLHLSLLRRIQAPLILLTWWSFTSLTEAVEFWGSAIIF